MRAKNKLSVVLWCTLAMQFNQIGFGVTPPRSNFHFIFENTFEDDQLGVYTLGDYNEDWFSPEWNHRRDKCDIIKDANPKYNKYMRGYFPNGIFSVENSGFGWQSPVQEQVTEMYFSYDVRFKPGFEWVKGGKLPGMIGGPLLTTPTGLEATSGYSTRPMWKQDGRIVMYIYHHDMTGEYGDTYNWDLVNNTAFQFQTGQWYNVTLRVVLNSINTSTGKGNNDGILEGWIDGDLRYQRTNYKFRNSENIKFDYLYVTAFFGGGTQDWAATRDEWMDTDNYVAFSYSSNVGDVPRGFQASSTTKKLVHPYLENEGSVAIPVSGISITPATTSISIGAEKQLTATVAPGDASNKSVTWSSSDAAIATVNTSGVVTGNAEGLTTISATTQDGSKIASSSITVTLEVNSPNSLLTGITSYYKFDESNGIAKDETGFNNGSVSTGVTCGSAGKINGAYLFDNDEDFVALTSGIVQKTGSYSFWLNIAEITDDLLILGNNAFSSRIYIGSSNNLKVETNTNGEEFAFYTSFSTEVWYNVVLTRDANTVNFYRNGSYIGTSTISGSDNLTLSQIGFNGRSFKGTLDEVGIWSRALSPAEVSALYNSGNGNSYPFATSNTIDDEVTTQPKIESIKELASESFVYPNPATDRLNFKNVSSGRYQVFIYDMSGKMVMGGQIDENSIDISNLKPAVYIIKLKENEITHIEKFIKK